MRFLKLSLTLIIDHASTWSSQQVELRSSSSNLLVQPPSKTKFGSLAFHTAAPLIWNGLPADVRSDITFVSNLQENAQNSLFPQPSHQGHVLVPRLRFVSTGPPGPCHYDLGVCFKLSLLLLHIIIIIPRLRPEILEIKLHWNIIIIYWFSKSMEN